MKFDFYSMSLMLALVSLCLAAFLIYNNSVFNTNKGTDILSVQTKIVFLSCLLETGIVIGRIKFSDYWTCLDVIELVSLMLHLVLYISILKFFYETISFAPKLSHRTKILSLGAILVISLVAGWYLSGTYIFFDNGFYDAALAADSIYEAEKILLMLLAAMVIAAIIVGKKLGRKSDVKLAVSALSIIVFHFLVDQMKSRLLPMGVYRSNSFQFALTYSLIFTIIGTSQMVRKKSQEAAIQAELDMARHIQLDALTHRQPAFENFPDIQLLACMDTAKSVGGDFYDYFELDPERIAFLIADVSGKGIPAALFMMTAKNTIKAVAKGLTEPSEIMTQANQILSEHNDSMMFVTVWLGIYNTDTHILSYTNAGHNPQLLLSVDGSVQELSERHGIIAGVDTSNQYTSSALNIKPGDRLFLYTDGLSEAHNSQSELFGESAVADILKEAIKLDNRELLNKMKASVQDFCKDTPQFDDITMMVVTFDFESAVSAEKMLDFLDGI